MNQNVFTTGFMLASIALVAVVASTGSIGLPAATGGVLKYHSNVCIELTRSDGTHYTVECKDNPNFFTPFGRNAVEDLLGGGTLLVNGVAATVSNFTNIALCNITNGATSVASCYITGGLTNGTGTYAHVGTQGTNPGNWSISKTFTATSDGLTVNGTELLNASSSGVSSTGSVVFANNTFTQVTLNTNDQITIRWNISIK